MKTNLDHRFINEAILFMLIDYFNSHIKPIKDYSDLSEEDKNIISSEIFNAITIEHE